MRADLRLSLPVFLATLLLLAWAPLPLGSNRPWSAGVLWTGLLLLAALLALANLDRASQVFERLRPAALPLLLFALWCVTGVLQQLPLPGALLDWMAPASSAHWDVAGGEGWRTISVDPGTTLADTLQSLALVALLLLLLVTMTSWRRLLGLSAFIAAMATLQALMGVIVELATGHGLLASGPEEGVGGASGSFVNPNHFAGFIEIGLGMSLGLVLLGPPLVSGAGSLRGLAQGVTEQLLSPRSLLLLVQVIMLAGLFWSGSRGGLLAILAGSAVGMALGIFGRGSGSAVPMLAALAMAVLLTLAWWGPGTLKQKFDAQGLQGNRLAIFAASLSASRDYPVFGAGAGTFRYVFPAYKTESSDLRFYEHAHNDYLEELVERGGLGASCFALGILTSLIGIARRLRQRRSQAARAVLTGALVAGTSVAVHSLYDFNLQIPANAAYFIAVLAAGLAAGSLPRAAARPPRVPSPVAVVV